MVALADSFTFQPTDEVLFQNLLNADLVGRGESQITDILIDRPFDGSVIVQLASYMLVVPDHDLVVQYANLLSNLSFIGVDVPVSGSLIKSGTSFGYNNEQSGSLSISTEQWS